MAVKEYVVTAGSIVARVGKDGKQARRYDQRQKVKLDSTFNNVDNLLARKAIAETGDDVKYPTTYQQVVASNQANQAARMQLVDSGEIAQSEDTPGGPQVNPLDDGGAGSTPTPPPGADDTPEPGSTLNPSK